MNTTSQPPDPVAHLPRRSRALIWVILILAVIGILSFGLFRSKNAVRADIAAGYMARTVCACRYVGGRDMASCLTDAEPGMEIVSVHEDAATKTITASVPLMGSRQAQVSPPVAGLETGCTLLN
jgi:hypothetical protein